MTFTRPHRRASVTEITVKKTTHETEHEIGWSHGNVRGVVKRFRSQECTVSYRCPNGEWRRRNVREMKNKYTHYHPSGPVTLAFDARVPISK